MRLGGKDLEDAVRLHHEQAGWLTHRADPVTRYKWEGNERVQDSQHDLFGVFDVIAINPQGSVRLIQATTRSGVSERMVKISKKWEWPVGDSLEVQIWVWEGDQFRVWDYQEGPEWNELNPVDPAKGFELALSLFQDGL